MFAHASMWERAVLFYALTVMTVLLYSRYMLLYQEFWPLFILTLTAYVPLCLPLLKVACIGLVRHRRLNEQFLMLLATFGALALQDFPEALAVLVFYRVGQLFEDYAQGRTRSEISALIMLKPSVARLVHEDGTEEFVKPRRVEIGQIIRVQAGESIPLDGTLLTDQALLDPSALTGESMPLMVHRGEEVLSGCINTSSLIDLKVTHDYHDSSLTRLLNLIEDAATLKSNPETLITRFAQWYTPIVVFIALLLALVPLVFNSESFSDWITRALVFLIVSCPCALVLSVPLSFFGGLGALSKLGVMVKGSVYLEIMAKLKMLCFDKTGTLTSGKFTVSRVEAAADEQEFLQLLYALESHSSHPLARGVCAYVQELGLEPPQIKALTETPGLGLEGRLDGKRIYAGRSEFVLPKIKVSLPEPTGLGTEIYVGRGDEYLGRVVLSDELKAQARLMLMQLHELKVDTCLITGDRREPAQKVARELGMTDVLYEQMPEDKIHNFARYKERAGLTGFVGDGINDAPVLTAADVGFAMGQFGSAAACEAADVVIMNDDLLKIPRALKVARKTYNLALQNIWFSLGVKLMILLLGALGIANIWIAIFGDVGVLVLVVLNAMRSMGFVKGRSFKVSTPQLPSQEK